MVVRRKDHAGTIALITAPEGLAAITYERAHLLGHTDRYFSYQNQALQSIKKELQASIKQDQTALKCMKIGHTLEPSFG